MYFEYDIPGSERCLPRQAVVFAAFFSTTTLYFVLFRCGNVAAILQLDENLQREFTIFEAAPQVRVYLFMQKRV